MRVAQLQRLTRACGVAYPPSVQLRTTVSETGPAAQLSVGDSLTTERVFGHDDVHTYCMLTGDSNPIHTDQAAARAAGLKSCLVPGMLLASLFPALVGSHLPGTLYLTQSLNFRATAPTDAPLEARVTVTRRTGRRILFDTACILRSSGTVVVDGTALAMLPP